jgi:hypothetical protein
MSVARRHNLLAGSFSLMLELTETEEMDLRVSSSTSHRTVPARDPCRAVCRRGEGEGTLV